MTEDKLPVLRAINITKRFPGVLANDHISFELYRGEVLAFLGENGAGKSTLMNILYGLYSPDEGQIFLHAKQARITSPSDAIAQGIGMVHQHFMLIPVMTVAENIALGNETQTLFGLNLTSCVLRFRSFLRHLNLLSHFKMARPEAYRLSLAGVGWAIAYLILYGFSSLLLLLGQEQAFLILVCFLLGLFWAAMLIDCLRRPTEEFGIGSKASWLAINLAGNILGALVYNVLVAWRNPLPWRRRWLVVPAASLALTLLLWLLAFSLRFGAALIPALAYGLKILAYPAAIYPGLWLVLGLYLGLLEILLWLTELVPLGINVDIERVREISQSYGLEVEPEAYIKDLPVGLQQRVEILKALYREADILILDEPTAVLTPQESDELFTIMRSLVGQGKSIIFITHKLKEVLAVADRIIVLRDGRVVGETVPKEATEKSLANMMVGREVILTVDKEPARLGEVVLRVEDLHALDDRGTPVVNGVSFEVRAGEILGIAGVQGNGQTELVEVLTGLRPAKEGRVFITGVETTYANPRQIMELGVAHVPEDRQRDGLVLSYPIYDNFVLCNYYQPPFAQGVLRKDREVYRYADDLVETFDIRTPGIFIPVNSLSGGNQQKVIVARELSRPIKLLIAAQPTRGLDVGSIEFIHNHLVKMRDEGCAVLLVSAELDEIMSLSDRIAVMYEGRIVATLPAERATREELGLFMAGAKTEIRGKEGAI